MLTNRWLFVDNKALLLFAMLTQRMANLREWAILIAIGF